MRGGERSRTGSAERKGWQMRLKFELAALSGVVALVTATAMTSIPAAAADDAAAAGAAGDPAAGQTVAVTLVTGDTVTLETQPDGRRAATIQPAEGRDDIAVHQLEVDGRLHVIPLDAVPFIATGQLDRALFDVDGLIAQGYDDASTDTLPVIATAPADSVTALGEQPWAALAGVGTGSALDSIDGRSIEIDKTDAGAFWAAIAPGSPEIAAHGTDADVALGGGIGKLWLDARVEATLDRSVAQIGAPTAWEAGFDGTGVTVAVLDTGVDADHPDLTGRVVAEQDFTGSPSTDDKFGHGTHVAATIAGTGDASDGLRPGVAPGAALISGKVLGDDGTGSLSGVIAGMEWATETGADVVNMSLGSGPSDGSDPLSLAVNELTATTGTLFVVSAGNDGPGASTVGSPGSADAALTVGAVDRDESIAEFSSRGPRLGDLAVKPDITAPGVGIVAARAAGTALGTPVDDLYTSASGTSMAAPHVAGAAALLAAQHPDWTATQLKDALVSTAAAAADLTVFEQGGGRVDVARAVTQQVHGTGTLDLGSYVDEDVEPSVREITYTNPTDTGVELSLALDLGGLGGEAPAEGAVTLAADAVTVPAGGTASVAVTIDPAALERGRYAGSLTATAGDVAVHTTLGLIKQAPIHTVTFTGVGFDGEPSFVTPLVLFGEDPRFDTVTFVRTGETIEVPLGEGDYFLHAMMTPEVDGADTAVIVTDPDLEVTGDADIVLDARAATQVVIDTPQPAELRGNLGFITYRDIGERTFSNSTMQFDTTKSVWVTPTEEAKDGTFEFTSRWQLAAPMLVASATGRGELAAWPHYLRTSPAIDGTRRLEVVAAGQGRPEDYDGVNVRGKIALVSPPEQGSEDIDAAVAAGAAMVLIVPPDGRQWWTKWTGRGERLPIPAAVLSPAEARAVLARLASGRLTLNLSGAPDSPYFYDVVQVSSGRVPDTVVHEVSSRNSATITADYHEMGGEEWSKEQRFAWRPWQQTTIVETQRELRTPQRRTEIVSAGDTLWRQHVLHFFSWDTMNPITGGATHALRTYRPRETVRQSWYGAVVRPAVPEGGVAYREGDALTIRVPEFVGSGEVTSARQAGDQVTSRLYEGDQLLAEGDSAWGTFQATAESARYRLDLVVDRDDPDWEFSTHTETSWEFDSARPAIERTALPLLQVDYDVPVDLANQVRGGRRETLGFTVRLPDGLRDLDVERFEAWVSFDDGATWVELEIQGRRGSYSAPVRHPGAGGHVSLRVQAEDGDGNTLTQTVERAYGISSR